MIAVQGCFGVAGRSDLFKHYLHGFLSSQVSSPSPRCPHELFSLDVYCLRLELWCVGPGPSPTAKAATASHTGCSHGKPPEAQPATCGSAQMCATSGSHHSQSIGCCWSWLCPKGELIITGKPLLCHPSSHLPSPKPNPLPA